MCLASKTHVDCVYEVSPATKVTL